MKLGKEASRAEHELRRLVCHANILDMLMEELSDRERGLEGRVNALIRAAPEPRQGRRVQFIDTIVEELEEVESDSDSGDSSDYDSDSDSDEGKGTSRRSTKVKSPVPKLWVGYVASQDRLADENEAVDQDAEDGDLVLQRWPSKGFVPELTRDGDSESDDEGPHGTPLRSFAKQCSISTNNTQKCGALRLGGDMLIAATVVH
jgi:hypothetical protein